MQDNEPFPYDLITEEYFRQYENIVRGGNRKNCIKQFQKFCTLNQGDPSANEQERVSDLTAGLDQAPSRQVNLGTQLVDELRSFPFRPFIYFLLATLVCVLLLNYAKH